MRREERFVLSHRPYAVDLTSFRTINPKTGLGNASEWTWARIEAVWFRRRKGVTVACVGHLWDLQRPAPVDAAQFLKEHTDGRHGGDCHGRWDGERYRGSQLPDVIAQHLELLRPMLANHPATPAGYEGWYVF